MMDPPGPPANGVGGPTPSAHALGVVEETPPAAAGGTRPPTFLVAPPPRVQRYRGARRIHHPPQILACIYRRSPLTCSISTWGTIDRGDLKISSPISITKFIIPTQTLPAFATKGNIKENYALIPTAASTRPTTPTTSRLNRWARRAWGWWHNQTFSLMKS